MACSAISTCVTLITLFVIYINLNYLQVTKFCLKMEVSKSPLDTSVISL